ncbi:MAG: hypothetical protein QM610_07070 [Chitinophagaceae bacterium]
MEVQTSKAFIKDAAKLPKSYRQKVNEMVETLKAVTTLKDLHFVEPMSGYAGFYKIRIGYLRIGLFCDETEAPEVVLLMCVLPRGDVYKSFPPQRKK